jgi:hypothetical protein
VHDGEREAAVDSPLVDENGAGAALALIAPLFASGEMQVFAQGIEERRAGIDVERVNLAVDSKLD